jgi:hypothetical protein
MVFGQIKRAQGPIPAARFFVRGREKGRADGADV